MSATKDRDGAKRSGQAGVPASPRRAGRWLARAASWLQRASYRPERSYMRGARSTGEAFPAQRAR